MVKHVAQKGIVRCALAAKFRNRVNHRVDFSPQDLLGRVQGFHALGEIQFTHQQYINIAAGSRRASRPAPFAWAAA